MKKKLLTSLALSIAMLLTACSAGGHASMDAASSAPGAMAESSVTTNTKGEYAPDEEFIDFSSGDISQYADGLKLVYNGYMNLETTDFDGVAQSLSQLVGEYHGYFSNSSISQFGSDYRYGEYTIRIPAASYEAFHQSVGQLCLVTRDSTTTEDISSTYYDTQGRLETQQIKLDRLQSLLKEATNMEDLITIEAAISETQWQIDNLSGEMNYYDSIVDYATIDLSLNEVYQLSNVQEAPRTFVERMGNSLLEGTRDFVDNLEDLTVSLAYNWLTLLILAVVVVFIIKVRPKTLKISILKKKEIQTDDENK